MIVKPRFGSVLTKLIKYHPNEVRLMTNTSAKLGVAKLLTEDILLSREEDIHNDRPIGLNIVQLACKYHPEALMFLLSSGHDLTKQITEITGPMTDRINALKLAILYQPESVTILLKSKYGAGLIAATNPIMNKSCLVDSIYEQPASFGPLLTYATPAERDFNGDPFKVFSEINPNYYTITAKTDLYATYPLMKELNERCTSDDPNLCTICTTFKRKVIFAPCQHTACVTCSTTLSKCHQCRTDIKQYLVAKNS
jgi:hypothetical protein